MVTKKYNIWEYFFKILCASFISTIYGYRTFWFGVIFLTYNPLFMIFISLFETSLLMAAFTVLIELLERLERKKESEKIKKYNKRKKRK